MSDLTNNHVNIILESKSWERVHTPVVKSDDKESQKEKESTDKSCDSPMTTTFFLP